MVARKASAEGVCVETVSSSKSDDDDDEEDAEERVFFEWAQKKRFLFYLLVALTRANTRNATQLASASDSGGAHPSEPEIEKVCLAQECK